MEGGVYMDSPSHDRNPSPPPEIREHGELVDAESIGSTAFSKHWLFSTLMKLIEEVDRENRDGRDLVVDVDEDLQNELCSLWDMSMNSEVSQFLDEFKAVEILTGIIDKSKAPRVTEICVGILGNMACEATVCRRMSDNARFIELVLLLLETRDTPTLVETTRLIYTSLSNTGSRGPWIKSAQRSEDMLSHLQFIFESSTNCDLLKNAAELVDTLLDLESDLCVSWATIDFIQSLLEATEQIGSQHSEALAVYLHIFQSFSTTEPGVEALVQNTARLQRKLLKYLNIVCEYEIVGIDSKEAPLTSALSVLNMLFSTQLAAGFTPDALKIYTDEHLMRVFLKILEPLYPLLENCKCEMLKLSNSNSANQPLTEETSDHVTSTGQLETGIDHGSMAVQSETTDHVTSSDQSEKTVDYVTSENQAENAENGCQTSSKNGNKLERTESRIEEEYRKLSVLYEIVSGFIVDYCRFLLADTQAIEPQSADTTKEPKTEADNGCILATDAASDGSLATDAANRGIPATGTTMDSNSADDITKGSNSEQNAGADVNNSNTLMETKSNEGTCSEDTECLVQDKGDNHEETASTMGDNLHVCTSVITYLDESCSRCRINYLALTLNDLTAQNGGGLTDALINVAERFGKHRLTRVLNDISSGRIVKRAESSAIHDPEAV